MKRVATAWLYSSLVVGIVACGAASSDGQSVPGQVAQVEQAVQRDPVNLLEQDDAGWLNLLTTMSSPVFAAIRDWDGTCGATFISEHHAITAAHCTKGVEIGDLMILQTILTENLVWQEVLDAAVVSGTSNPGSDPPSTIGPPNFDIADELTESEGYSRTGYFCVLTHRCASPLHGWGERHCPGSTDADIALVRCSGRPSPLDWISVHTGDPTSGDAQVIWFHEILDLQQRKGDTASNNNVPADNWWNYGYYGDDHLDNNYHYSDSMGHELLPLWSATHSDGPNYKLLGAAGPQTNMMDIPACHGTSGSATLLQGTSSLVGPVVTGSGLGSRLCHDFQNTTPGINYTQSIRAPISRILESTPDVQNDR